METKKIGKTNYLIGLLKYVTEMTIAVESQSSSILDNNYTPTSIKDNFVAGNSHAETLLEDVLYTYSANKAQIISYDGGVIGTEIKVL